jgi:membrane protein YqaA with SNARE-associated domain/membrane-associated phospholipid phosphatase
MGNWIISTTHFFIQYGMVGLFVLSFVEASFFPIPPYLLSIPMTLTNPRMGLIYALVGILGSVLGGFLGYAIGSKLGRPLLLRIMKPAVLDKVETSFSKYGGWAIAAGGLTPIPFKFFTIAAGVFRVRLLSFIPASVIARSIRFIGEALLLMIYGRKVLSFLEYTLGLVNLMILSIILIVLTFIWRTRFLQKKLLPFLQRTGQVWTAWFTDLWHTVFLIGKFSWYLITGATLTIFSFLFFTKLASELLENELTHFDRMVGQWVIFFRSSWLTPVMSFITNLGSTGWVIGIIVAITIIGISFRSRLEVLGLNICVVGAVIFSQTLKVSFHRTRPDLPWLTPASGYSFPSGHALISLALYGFIAYLILRNLKWPRWRFLLAGSVLLIPVLIGISRVYLGVHYPSDVLGGWAVATAWMGTCIAGVEFLYFKSSGR